jgi:hypothetical protein
MITRKFSILLVICFTTLSLIPSAHTAPKTYSLSITIVGPYNWRSLAGTEAEARNPRECYAGQYAVLSSGATVRIKNSSNKILGAGKTSWKVVEVTDSFDTEYSDPSDATSTVRYKGTCVLTTKISKLPKSSFYQIQVGSKDAGVYEFAELVADKWKLVLTYG